jgi:SAM-dependent methyltransferase
MLKVVVGRGLAPRVWPRPRYDRILMGTAGAAHWDAAFAGGDAERSWYQEKPSTSLLAIGRVAPDRDAAILDVGGGSSALAGALLAAGYRDLTVLDVSKTALSLAQNRLGKSRKRIAWIAADLLTWRPPRRYFVWHDRAVLHFFVNAEDRRNYARTLHEALAPGGYAIIATFAPGGPKRCSGLPVRNSSADDILELLDSEFSTIESSVQIHTTPSNMDQPFTWVTARRGHATPSL